MSWPTGTIATTHLDSDTDSPLLARPAIKNIADKVNEIVANGAPYLDSNMVEAATASKGVVRTSSGRIKAVSAASSDDTVTLGQVQHAGALVYHSTTQAVANSTDTPLVFNSEIYDTDTIHDTVSGTSRLTVPTGWTKARLMGQVGFAVNGTGYRAVKIWKNGAVFAGGINVTDTSPGVITGINVATAVLAVTAGDYFELVAYQTSGGSLNVDGTNWLTWFAIEKVL